MNLGVKALKWVTKIFYLDHRKPFLDNNQFLKIYTPGLDSERVRKYESRTSCES